MNRDQYAQKQRWLQGDADERVAALLRRDAPRPRLPGDERRPSPRHFSHLPPATPAQRKAPLNP